MWMIYKSMHTKIGAGVIIMAQRGKVLKAQWCVLLQCVPESYGIYNVKTMRVGFITKPADVMTIAFKQLVKW